MKSILQNSSETLSFNKNSNPNELSYMINLNALICTQNSKITFFSTQPFVQSGPVSIHPPISKQIYEA